MKYKLVAVKDLKIQAFMPTTSVQHVGQAIRSFSEAANDPKHEFFKYAPDFELYELAEIDDSDGSFDVPEEPKLLSRAIDVKIAS